MKRISTAVIGALALGFTGAGLAAGGYDGSSGMSGSGGAGGSTGMSTQSPDLSSSFKSTDLIGMNVANSRNDSLGSISNLIVDKDGKVSHVVLSESTGAKKYIVPWNRVSITPGQDLAMVDVDPNALASEFAAFDESMTAPVTGSSPSGTYSAPPAGGSGGSMSTPPSGSSGGSGGY